MRQRRVRVNEFRAMQSIFSQRQAEEGRLMNRGRAGKFTLLKVQQRQAAGQAGQWVSVGSMLDTSR